MKSSAVAVAIALALGAGHALAITPAQAPSLASQLDGVRPGSALERLIKLNQDFSELRADEVAGNRANLPPWMKAWWRRQHPEGHYTAEDPSGGYPHVLNEVLEWMRSHQDLQPGPADADAADQDEDARPKTASVSGEVRESGAQSSARSESDIRVNYWNPQKILGASNSISAGGTQSVFRSLDGGATWSQTTLPLVSPDTSHSDPTVDWTSDGKAWSTTLGIQGSTLKLRSYVSTDNGATWTNEATPSAAQTNVDKQMVWVDHSATSSCKDFQHAIWHNGSPAFVSTRNATTGTWGAPIQVSGAETTGTAIGSDVRSNTFGDAFGFFPDTGSRRLNMVKSTNCGTSWSAPVRIATSFDGYDIGVPSFANRRVLIYLSGGAFRNATKNLVYAVWADLSGETGCTAAANEPGSNVASTCKTRIWFARSTDGGTTWQAPVMINNQPSLNDQFNPWLAVDEATGALGVMYYDTVADAGRKKVHVYYQSSFSDGQTWFAPVQVTSVQTDETSAGADTGNQFGDYNAMSGYAGVFFPSWTDRRSGAHEEIWTAKISDQVCTFPGSPTAPTATTPANNQVQVAWTNGTPSANKFNIYRAVGTCAAPGTFSQIASGVAASPYLDSTVSGSITYAYKVSGADATGACESTQSSCVEVTATGQCTLAPNFTGAAAASNSALATCSIGLTWPAATAQCAGPSTYNIYRSTSPNFTPAPANRIATGVGPSPYTDVDALVSGTRYYYEVHAVDGSNGAEDGNTIERNAVVTGPISSSNLTETFEGAGGFDLAGWTHASVAGTVDWTLSTTQPQTPTHSWASASQTTATDRVLVSPSFVVIAGTTLSFFHTYAFEGSLSACYDGGTLEISSDNGATWATVADAAFTAGGFTGSINGGFSNPIAGKRAWCAGTVGAMTQVSVNLGGTYNGQTVKLRWHAGDDSSTAVTGWFVDSVTINNAGSAATCTTAAAATLIFKDGFE